METPFLSQEGRRPGLKLQSQKTKHSRNRAGRPRTHLNRKVKAITGGTTSDLVLSYRIAKAKELLLTTDLPVWEVAEKCGISDPAYFSTLFKKAVGKSPGQLRKEQCNYPKKTTCKNLGKVNIRLARIARVIEIFYIILQKITDLTKA